MCDSTCISCFQNKLAALGKTELKSSTSCFVLFFRAAVEYSNAIMGFYSVQNKQNKKQLKSDKTFLMGAMISELGCTSSSSATPFWSEFVLNHDFRRNLTSERFQMEGERALLVPLTPPAQLDLMMSLTQADSVKGSSTSLLYFAS